MPYRSLQPLSLAVVILVGCIPAAYEADPDGGGSADQRPGGADLGRPGADVAVGNDGGGAADGGQSPGDGGGSCGVPESCEVEFSFPAGAESTVELFGDFDDWSAGVPLVRDGASWRTTLTLEHGQRVLYKFVIDGESWVADPANPQQTSDGNGNSILDVVCADPCADGGTQPDGGGAPAFDWADGVMYFVLLDRFFDGDPGNNSPESGVKTPANFQGGDLAGLLAKINSGYFEQLGVNVLWISSPVDAPDGHYDGVDGEQYTGYHGYWPTDLDKVEERLGNLALLEQVVTAAHAHGLRIVMDYVMNHVHQNSPVFSAHGDWFWPLDFFGKYCVCGQGCSWDADPDRLRCWFMGYLPDFDFTKPAARDFSVNNAIKWVEQTGVDGYRLDAVKHIDSSWLTELRARLTAHPQIGAGFYLVGETFTNSKDLLKQYVDPQTKLDGQFDFPLRAELARVILRRQGSFYDLHAFLDANNGFYGPQAVMGTFIGNHDLPRAIHLAEDVPQFGDWDSGKSRAWYNTPAQPDYDRPYQRLALAFTALLTLPGMPLIYYGDEIGLAGGGDPDNRRFMQWSGHKPYQLALKQRISALTAIRAAHPALRRGQRQQLWVANDVYAYRMSHAGDELVVVLNRSDSEQTISLPGVSYTDLLSGNTVDAQAVVVGARDALVLE